MAIGHVPPSARRAEWMRERWRPYGERLASGGGQVKSYLVAHPATAQAVYYVLTGVWPLVSISSFLWVTGPKTDVWLVQTFGLLITAVGVALGVAAWRGERTWSIVCLALGTAGALLAADVFFVLRGDIGPVYLLDAVAEAVLIGLWVAGWRRPDAVAAEAPVARLATAEEAAHAP